MRHQKTLYLRYDTQNGITHSNVLSILKDYPGDVPVIVKCTSLNKAFKISYLVNPNDYLMNELYSLLEEQNIKLL